MKIDVKHIAKLANLTISPEEEPKLEKQLEEILSYFDKLKEVDTSGIEETSQVTGLENVTREDAIRDCTISQKEAISGSKSTHNGLFKVKAVLENS
ncbi:MAG: Asp-tRNA(Asn)/Glu-tRNA(Gln) amidotransferase subunit GatC [Candidatus Levyibacteriota bacterium]